MKFLIDEDCPYSLLEVFRKYKHQAFHVRDIMRSAPDQDIFEYANKNSMIIVTRDLGFGNMFIDKGGFGLLLSRLPFYFTAGQTANTFDNFLKSVDKKIFPLSITVLELTRYRIRKL